VLNELPPFRGSSAGPISSRGGFVSGAVSGYGVGRLTRLIRSDWPRRVTVWAIAKSRCSSMCTRRSSFNPFGPTRPTSMPARPITPSWRTYRCPAMATRCTSICQRFTGIRSSWSEWLRALVVRVLVSASGVFRRRGIDAFSKLGAKYFRASTRATIGTPFPAWCRRRGPARLQFVARRPGGRGMPSVSTGEVIAYLKSIPGTPRLS